MEILILPAKSRRGKVYELNSLEVAPELSLGGYFYDYLRDLNAHVRGIRYYIDGSQKFSLNAILLSFNEDKRFRFRQDLLYVDIMFEEAYLDSLSNDMLVVDPVQDFAGVQVIRFDEAYGLLISLSML